MRRLLSSMQSDGSDTTARSRRSSGGTPSVRARARFGTSLGRHAPRCPRHAHRPQAHRRSRRHDGRRPHHVDCRRGHRHPGRARRWLTVPGAGPSPGRLVVRVNPSGDVDAVVVEGRDRQPHRGIGVVYEPATCGQQCGVRRRTWSGCRGSGSAEAPSSSLMAAATTTPASPARGRRVAAAIREPGRYPRAGSLSQWPSSDAQRSNAGADSSPSALRLSLGIPSEAIESRSGSTNVRASIALTVFDIPSRRANRSASSDTRNRVTQSGCGTGGRRPGKIGPFDARNTRRSLPAVRVVSRPASSSASTVVVLEDRDWGSEGSRQPVRLRLVTTAWPLFDLRIRTARLELRAPRMMT